MAGTSDTATRLEPRALALVEEAVHLLRSCTAADWCVYLAGAGPWAFGFLFFWAYVTWFTPSEAALAGGSLLLVLVFAGLKAAQAAFCQRLLARCLGKGAGARGAQTTWAVVCAQVRLHPWALLVLPVALVLSVPFGWVFAFFQTATVVGASRTTDVLDCSVTEAKRWPAQNHLGLLFLSVIAGAVWINVAAAFLVVPYLLNRFLGVENAFALSGWSVVNSTFLAFVTTLAWAVMDPLVKAFYVLRVFHGQAQRTGEDLAVDLSRLRGKGRSGTLAVLVLGVLCLGPGARQMRAAAAETPPEPAGVEAAPLNAAIDLVLQGAEYQWKLKPAEVSNEEAENGGMLVRFVRGVAKFLRQSIDAGSDWLARLARFFRELFTDVDSAPDVGAPAKAGTLRVLLYASTTVLVLLLVWYAWRRRAGRTTVASRAQAAATPVPDLADENLQASQLTTDEWTQLAREQLNRGEGRLALRALYLATLSRLAGEGRIVLANAKTNLDYERELRRRTPGEPKLHEAFSERRNSFERVWYGRGETDPEEVRVWLGGLSEGRAL